MFLVDGSESIIEQDWAQIIDFMLDVGNALNIDGSTYNIGVGEYSSTYQLIQEPFATTQAEYLAMIQDPTTGLAVRQSQGITFTATATMQAVDDLVAKGRSGKPRILVLITDGQTSRGDVDNLSAAVDKLVANGVIPITIGVGPNTDVNELTMLALGVTRRVFPDVAFDQLPSIVAGLIAAIEECVVQELGM